MQDPNHSTDALAPADAPASSAVHPAAPAAPAFRPIPAIEQALDLLCTAPPKPRETVLQFVQRCVKVVQGRTQRAQLERAILDTVNQLGLRALDPASHLQLALNATEEEKAAATAEQDAPEATATAEVTQ